MLQTARVFTIFPSCASFVISLEKWKIPSPFRHLRNSFSHWTRALLFFLGFHWIRVKGKVAPPTEAPLLVLAPHSSWLDVLVMCMAGVPSGLSKMENMDAPIIGGVYNILMILLTCDCVSIIYFINVVFPCSIFQGHPVYSSIQGWKELKAECCWWDQKKSCGRNGFPSNCYLSRRYVHDINTYN